MNPGHSLKGKNAPYGPPISTCHPLKFISLISPIIVFPLRGIYTPEIGIILISLSCFSIIPSLVATISFPFFTY